MSIREIFAANVRRHRKAAGLSQEKLAEIAGLHRTYIGGIEQKRVNVSLKNISRIADALKVDPVELFVDEHVEDPVTWRQVERCAADLFVEDEGGNPKLAVITWADGDMRIEPLSIAYEDLTVQVLVELVERGYTGDDLSRRYAEVTTEIIRFLRDAE